MSVSRTCGSHFSSARMSFWMSVSIRCVVIAVLLQVDGGVACLTSALRFVVLHVAALPAGIIFQFAANGAEGVVDGGVQFLVARALLRRMAGHQPLPRHVHLDGYFIVVAMLMMLVRHLHRHLHADHMMV